MPGIRNFAYIVLALFLSSLFLGCMGTKEPGVDVKADGKVLYDYITKEENYKNWKGWPGKDELFPGREPHGILLTTYVTGGAFSAIEEKKGSLPYGSIIVKENYCPEKMLKALTVMYKVKGYDAEHNDWFWASYLPDGEIVAEGMVKECNDCHGQRKDNDYIMTDEIK